MPIEREEEGPLTLLDLAWVELIPGYGGTDREAELDSVPSLTVSDAGTV